MALIDKPSDVIVLAPDSASAKAAEALCSPRKWVSLSNDEGAVWGECSGSGQLPYQTIVDLSGPAFKCTCPSRKFPCKHGIALLLLFTQESGAFQLSGERPAWVSSWIDKRSDKTRPAAVPDSVDVRSESKLQSTSKKTDPRVKNVESGVIDLKHWLRDLVREGLAEVPAKGYKYWENMAARMVDAQAPGVARWLREMGALPNSGTGWQKNLLERIALLHLLLEGFENRNSLTAAELSDVKMAMGWTIPQEELLQTPGIVDEWIVIGQRITFEDRLRVRRSWLIGTNTGRRALLLHFAHGQTAFPFPIPPRTSIFGELVYYPGAAPMRAAFKKMQTKQYGSFHLPHTQELTDAIEDYSENLTNNPWIERWPICLRRVTPYISENTNVLESDGIGVEISPSFESKWELLAVSGGHPLEIAGEWDGKWFWPLNYCPTGK